VKVFLRPVGLHSRAMVRVADALAKLAPPDVQVVARAEDADVVLLHVIADDAMVAARRWRENGQRYAVAQYCLETTGAPDPAAWADFWRDAELVWSYYDLPLGEGYFSSPLGVDDVFRELAPPRPRERLVLTTGYVAGPGAEAIEEVWRAAEQLGYQAIHIGPRKVSGMRHQPAGWYALEGIPDERLADLYRRAEWVAALRHVEGFELPAAEGLVCGARPIAFDQPAMRRWYGGQAVLLPECSGDDLVRLLVETMSESMPITEWERQSALERFDWSSIATGFWQRLLQASEVAA
jgi:hypothetical protein